MLISALACTTVMGFTPAKIGVAPKFDLTLVSLTVENPQDGEVFGDLPFGSVVIASCNPKRPKVLGSFDFESFNPVKRNGVEPYNKTAKGIEFPEKESDYFIHVAAMERDDLMNTVGTGSIFLDVHNQNLTAYSQRRLATKLSITTKLRQDFREALRKGINITRILVNDDDIVQVRDFSFSKRELELAASSGFEKDFQFVKVGVPTAMGRYRLKFRLQRSQ